MATVSKSPIYIVKRCLEDFYSALNEDNDLLFSNNRGKGFYCECSWGR